MAEIAPVVLETEADRERAARRREKPKPEEDGMECHRDLGVSLEVSSHGPRTLGAAEEEPLMKSLELFTGAGGLALGTHEAGFRHVGLLEWNEDACDTLRRNSSEQAIAGISRWNVMQGDIRDVDFSSFGHVELVAGGVPCQPFSLGGKHKGMDDTRDMFPDFVRAVRTLQPKAFIIENVKGLLRASFAEYLAYIQAQLRTPEVPKHEGEHWQSHAERIAKRERRRTRSELGYDISLKLLNAADYGVPQTRERVFIVGFRRDLGIEWSFPRETHSYDALIRSQYQTAAYWKRHGVAAPPLPENLKPLLRRPADMFNRREPWVTLRDAICGLPEPLVGKDAPGFHNHRLNPGARPYPGHTGSDIDLPSKTLKAGVHGVPGGENMIRFRDGSVRYLTVREAARVQTFPDGWRFEGAWSEAMRQLGNAVPLQLARVVASSVGAALKPRLRAQLKHDAEARRASA